MMSLLLGDVFTLLQIGADTQQLRTHPMKILLVSFACYPQNNIRKILPRN